MTTDQLDNLTRYLRDGCPSSVAADLGAALEALGEMPCGHPAACVVGEGDGSKWCGWCSDRQRASAFESAYETMRRAYHRLMDVAFAPFTCPACGSCSWIGEEGCSTRWCDDCGREMQVDDDAYPQTYKELYEAAKGSVK